MARCHLYAVPRVVIHRTVVTRAPRTAAALADQGQPKGLGSRTGIEACPPGGFLEDLSWRPPQGATATARGAGGMRTSGHGWGRDGTGRRATHPWAQRDPGLGSLTSPSHSEELAHTWVSWPGSSAACSDPTPRRRGSGLHSRPRATASSARCPAGPHGRRPGVW